MIELIMEPLQYGFILRGLAAGLLAGISCALLSSFVVWRGMAFMGDAMAHAILPGIVAAYAWGFSLILGALGAAVVAVFAIGIISSRSSLKEDSAIGIVFAGLFALGILLLSRIASYQDLSHILFGNILGVSKADLITMSLVALGVLGVLASSFKELLVASFDPTHAVAIGISPSLIRYLLLLLLAFTTVIAIQSVGVVLVLALLVTPGATASVLTNKLGRMMGISVLTAIVSTGLGFYASYYWNTASGPTIVLVLIAIFSLAMLISFLRSTFSGSGNSSEHTAEESS
ncbi:metal ABC transporter permease [Salinispira pacifica]|nr:metal ABC transporter permease [Salinispira pacifica]